MFWSITALRSLADTHDHAEDRIAADLDVLEAVSAALLRGERDGALAADDALGLVGRTDGSRADGAVARRPFLGSRRPAVRRRRRRGRGRSKAGFSGASTVSVDALMGMASRTPACEVRDHDALQAGRGIHNG